MTDALHTLPGLGDVERRALRAYAEYTLSRYGDQVEALVLFGSHARGEAAPDSDIDLLVVLNREYLPDKNDVYLVGYGNPVWEDLTAHSLDILLEYDVYISPTLISLREYQQWSPLMENVQGEGVSLWTKRNWRESMPA